MSCSIFRVQGVRGEQGCFSSQEGVLRNHAAEGKRCVRSFSFQVWPVGTLPTVGDVRDALEAQRGCNIYIERVAGLEGCCLGERRGRPITERMCRRRDAQCAMALIDGLKPSHRRRRLRPR